MTQGLHATVETVLVLLLIAFVVALVARRLRLPYTVALVLAGLLGFEPGFREARLTPDLILVVFLPLLLFESAYNVSARSLRRDLLPVLLLAAPGVLLGMLATAAGLRAVLGLAWGVALLFGALIASTDPIAVVALFRGLGAPRRLALLVEGESLFNDGAAITLFGVVLGAVTTGRLSVGAGVLTFLVAVAGALAVGGAVGLLGAALLRAVDDAQILITGTVIAAYGAYLLAEHFAFSGAIAVVVAGLLIGNYGATGGLTLHAVRALGGTWEFLGFAANSLIFLLIGIALDPRQLVASWWPIAVAFVATLLARALTIGVLLPLLRGEWRVPRPYRVALLWGGLRGAVSLALALSVPLTLADGRPFPDRDLLLTLAFGVVGASLVLQGLTMRPLLRRLGLVGAGAAGSAEAALRARLHAIEAALRALTQDREDGRIGGLQYERLASAYRAEEAQLEAQLAGLQDPAGPA